MSSIASASLFDLLRELDCGGGVAEHAGRRVAAERHDDARAQPRDERRRRAHRRGVAAQVGQRERREHVERVVEVGLVGRHPQRLELRQVRARVRERRDHLVRATRADDGDPPQPRVLRRAGRRRGEPALAHRKLVLQRAHLVPAVYGEARSSRFTRNCTPPFRIDARCTGVGKSPSSRHANCCLMCGKWRKSGRLECTSDASIAAVGGARPTPAPPRAGWRRARRRRRRAARW